MRRAPEHRPPLRLLLVLGPLSAFGPLSMDLYLPALPDMARDLHSGDAAAQLTMSTCMVGLATGQLLAGPLSDRFGRRRPALLGVAAFVVASLGCALAPDISTLVVLRLLQGLAGAAGIVVGRAVVRDLYDGVAAARAFSLLALVTGVAPVLAPLAGGQITRLFPWQGQFVALAVVGAAIWLLVLFGLPETLPGPERHAGGLHQTLGSFGPVLRDPVFTGYTAVLALGMSGMFTYISASSLVLQDDFGLSPAAYSAVFAVNAVGIMIAGRVNATLVGRLGPHRLLAVGTAVPLGAAAVLTAGTLRGLGLWLLLPCLFLVVSATGLIAPNSTALAMTRHGRRAGTASAVLGLMQFLTGATLAPLAGIGGASASSMSITITAVLLAAASALLVVRRGERRAG